MRIEETLRQQVNKRSWIDDANVREWVGEWVSCNGEWDT